MEHNNEISKVVGEEVSIVADEKPALVDTALLFLHGTEELAYSVEEEKALVRKIDWMIMPLMATVYFLQFLDKNLINFANIMGLGKDTHTTAHQFSTLAWAFYVAYLAFEPLMAYLLQKLPVAKLLGVNVMLWGLVLALNCICTSYASLLTLRILLGVFEACVSPSMILISCMWYKRKEQPLRVGFWCGTVGLGIIVGALCSYGFQHYHGKSFKSWQIMFLVIGLITIVVGALVVMLLPDTPLSARLTQKEKFVAVARLRGDTTGIENKTFKPRQFLETMTDPHIWLICVITTAINIPNAAVSTFQASIIKGLGYTSEQSALLSLPSGVTAIIAIGAASYVSFYFNNRSYVIISLLIPGILGGALMAFLPSHDKTGRLMGTYLTNTIPSTTPLVYSWVAANFAGHTKKVTVNAMLLMSFCLGNVLGPLTFTTPPEYTAAKITIVAVLSFAILATVILILMYYTENKKRRSVADSATIEGSMDDTSFLDLTDRSNRSFMYII